MTNLGFTSHEHDDALGLINMKGRMYDAKLGRFLSTDPYIQALGNTQSLNRYSYVLNNPLSLTDPTGYYSWDDFKEDVAGGYNGVKDFVQNNNEVVGGVVAVVGAVIMIWEPTTGGIIMIAGLNLIKDDGSVITSTSTYVGNGGGTTGNVTYTDPVIGTG